MQERTVLKQLNSLGLKARAARIYLTLLKIGQAPVSVIAAHSHTPRTLTYDILDELVDRGLAATVKTSGVRKYSATNIDIFYKKQQEKLDRFQELLPEIRAITTVVGDRPTVRLLEGIEGIKAAFEESLETLPEGGEIIGYTTSQGYYESVIKHTKDYIRRRVAKRITARAIAPSDENINIFVQDKKKELRDIRVVPKDRFPFTNEINIYGNKVAIMSMQGELLAVIIESASVAKTQRSIFELAWLGAKQVQIKQKTAKKS